MWQHFIETSEGPWFITLVDLQLIAISKSINCPNNPKEYLQ